jgi:sugar phosphate isomerase/epimerase
MKRAASNLLMPVFDHFSHLPRLAERGIAGLEVAPFHTWPDAQKSITASDVKIYRRAAEVAGLEIIGLHGLTKDPLQIEQLGASPYRARIMAQFIHLSKVCRDLGGHTLIIEERKRGNISKREAWIIYRDFIEDLVAQVASHGTVFCLSPVGIDETDFCATPRETFMLANAISHDAYGIHLSTRGLTYGGKTGHQDFCESRGRVEHFHIEEPYRAELGTVHSIDHVDMRVHLDASTYKGWVSVVQNAGSSVQRTASLDRGLSFMEKIYFPYDLKYVCYDLQEELDESTARVPLRLGSTHSR